MNQKIRKIFFYYLLELAKFINKKEYRHHDRDDPDYYGIRDIENLFDMVDNEEEDYYKLILVNTSFKKKINIMEAEETEIRIYRLKDILIRLEHIYMI